MRRTPAEIKLDARYRERFRVLVGQQGKSPSRAISCIVDGEQAPWRPSARRVLELLDAGITPSEVKAVVLGELDRWIDEQAAARGLQPAA